MTRLHKRLSPQLYIIPAELLSRNVNFDVYAANASSARSMLFHLVSAPRTQEIDKKEDEVLGNRELVMLSLLFI